MLGRATTIPVANYQMWALELEGASFGRPVIARTVTDWSRPRPVKPTLATAGMTPTLARKIGADTAPVPGVTPAPAAPGPAVTNFLGRKPRLRNPPQVAMGEAAPPAAVPAQPGATGVQAPPQNGQPPKQAPVVTEVPPVAAPPGKEGAPAPTIPPNNPPVAGTDQAGKPGKPGKKPPATAQTEAPPAAGGKAGAPGPVIPPKTPPVAGTDQGGKPAHRVFSEFRSRNHTICRHHSKARAGHL